MHKDIKMILGGEDIKDVLEHFIEKGLPDCRFMLIMAINSEGQLGYYHAGNISGLEASGLPEIAGEIADDIREQLAEDENK